MSDDPSDPELHSCVRWGGYRCQGCVAEGERAATERWTKAAQEHAGTWLMFGTPDAEVIATDYLIWAASMQPLDDEGKRPFKLDAIERGAHR